MNKHGLKFIYSGPSVAQLPLGWRLTSIEWLRHIFVCVSSSAAHRLTPKHCKQSQSINRWIHNYYPFPPQIFLFHNVTIVLPEDFTQCTTRGSFVSHWHETSYNMFTFCCLFLLPLVIMITCYTRIFCEISKRLRKDNREFEFAVKLCDSVCFSASAQLFQNKPTKEEATKMLTGYSDYQRECFWTET